MTLDILMYGVMIVAALTVLTTEALKKTLDKSGVSHSSNSVSGWVAIVLSVALFFAYVALMEIAYSPLWIVYLFALAYLSWLSAMQGYDKVKQTIEQLRQVKP